MKANFITFLKGLGWMLLSIFVCVIAAKIAWTFGGFIWNLW